MEDDYTNTDVSKFIMQCIRAYTRWNVHSATCGTCSDHVPFHNAGYRVGCVAESGPYGVLNPYIHSARDTISMIRLVPFISAQCVHLKSSSC